MLRKSFSVTNFGSMNIIKRNESTMSWLSSFFDSKEKKIAKARLTHLQVVEKLSVGQSKPPPYIVNPILNDIKNKPLNSLKPIELSLLAGAYFEGVPEVGIEKDETKAVELWGNAAEEGYLYAIYKIAQCIKDGTGIKKNPSMSFDILNDLSKNHKYPLAHIALANMYLVGEGVAKDETRAIDLYKKAAIGGIVAAFGYIGDAYYEGIGVEKNLSNAMKYYNLASNAGDHVASFALGTMYFQGIGTPQNHSIAFSYYEIAASREHGMAMFNLGTMYFFGSGVTQNYSKAIEWYTKAMNKEYFPEAALQLSKMYSLGLGINKDIKKAISLIEPYAQRDRNCNEFYIELKSQL